MSLFFRMEDASVGKRGGGGRRRKEEKTEESPIRMFLDKIIIRNFL